MTSEERHELRYQRRKAKRDAKRKRKLLSFERVFSYSHMFKAYKKCCLGVRWKGSTKNYILKAPVYLSRTRSALLDGTFRSLGFYDFDLYERGKKRHIRSVKIQERVVQRCLCDYALVPIVESSFIYDSGASIKNKGYHFAMNRLVCHLQRYYREHGSEGYILLFDYHHFFDNVSHDQLKRELAKRIEDPDVLRLTYHFIDCFGEKGLGLGSQVSQTLALLSMNELDHIIKDKLQVKYYGRYMDDGYIIFDNKYKLRVFLNIIREYCRQVGAELNEKKTQIVKISHGFTWLKARIYLTPSGKVIKKIYKRSIVKQRQKLKKFRKKYDDGIMTAADVYHSYQSWRSYAEHFMAWHSIQNMDKLFRQLFIREDLDAYVFQSY